MIPIPAAGRLPFDDTGIGFWQIIRGDIGWSHYFPLDQLFQPVGGPSGDPRHGENRGIEFLGYSHEAVYETGIKIHIGLNGHSLPLGQHFGRYPVHPFQKGNLIPGSFSGGEVPGIIPQNDGAGVGEGVYRMAESYIFPVRSLALPSKTSTRYFSIALSSFQSMTCSFRSLIIFMTDSLAPRAGDRSGMIFPPIWPM